MEFHGDNRADICGRKKEKVAKKNDKIAMSSLLRKTVKKINKKKRTNELNLVPKSTKFYEPEVHGRRHHPRSETITHAFPTEKKINFFMLIQRICDLLNSGRFYG